MVEADSEGVVIEIMTIVFSIYRTKKKKRLCGGIVCL